MNEIIPAAGQGILAVQGRRGEDYSWLACVDDPESRAFLRAGVPLPAVRSYPTDVRPAGPASPGSRPAPAAVPYPSPPFLFIIVPGKGGRQTAE